MLVQTSAPRPPAAYPNGFVRHHHRGLFTAPIALRHLARVASALRVVSALTSARVAWCPGRRPVESGATVEIDFQLRENIMSVVESSSTPVACAADWSSWADRGGAPADGGHRWSRLIWIRCSFVRESPHVSSKLNQECRWHDRAFRVRDSHSAVASVSPMLELRVILSKELLMSSQSSPPPAPGRFRVFCGLLMAGFGVSAGSSSILHESYLLAFAGSQRHEIGRGMTEASNAVLCRSDWRIAPSAGARTAGACGASSARPWCKIQLMRADHCLSQSRGGKTFGATPRLK